MWYIDTWSFRRSCSNWPCGWYIGSTSYIITGAEEPLHHNFLTSAFCSEKRTYQGWITVHSPQHSTAFVPFQNKLLHSFNLSGEKHVGETSATPASLALHHPSILEDLPAPNPQIKTGKNWKKIKRSWAGYLMKPSKWIKTGCLKVEHPQVPCFEISLKIASKKKHLRDFEGIIPTFLAKLNVISRWNRLSSDFRVWKAIRNHAVPQPWCNFGSASMSPLTVSSSQLRSIPGTGPGGTMEDLEDLGRWFFITFPTPRWGW